MLLHKAYVNSLNFCQTYILGKQHKLSFFKEAHLAKACLKYMHVNLWELAKVLTLGGNKYFLFLMDDYSMTGWVYLLKSKDQALEKFNSWKNLVENQKDRKVKALRTDNGLEFCNTSLINSIVMRESLDIGLLETHFNRTGWLRE